MLDEKALRKPGWEEASGTWVTLGDGQRWLLPKPFVRTRATRVEGRLVLGSKTSFGPEFDALVKAVRDSDEETFVTTIIELASDMLGRNYGLVEDDRLDLIGTDSSGAASREWMGQALAVAYGNDAPKPSSGGSESPSTADSESEATSS